MEVIFQGDGDFRRKYVEESGSCGDGKSREARGKLSYSICGEIGVGCIARTVAPGEGGAGHRFMVKGECRLGGMRCARH